MFNVDHIVEIIKSKGLTCSSVEKSLGFGNGAIRRWEQSSPSITKVIELSNFLNISLSELLGETPSMLPDEAETFRLYKELSPHDQGRVLGYIEHLHEKSIDDTKKETAPEGSEAVVDLVADRHILGSSVNK